MGSVPSERGPEAPTPILLCEDTVARLIYQPVSKATPGCHLEASMWLGAAQSLGTEAALVGKLASTSQGRTHVWKGQVTCPGHMTAKGPDSKCCFLHGWCRFREQGWGEALLCLGGLGYQDRGLAFTPK